MAQRKRLPAAQGRIGGARQLHQTKNAFLRGQGKYQRAIETRLQLFAADSSRLRVAEVHAATPSRNFERRRLPGAVYLHAYAKRPGRADQLPLDQVANR